MAKKPSAGAGGRAAAALQAAGTAKRHKSLTLAAWAVKRIQDHAHYTGKDESKVVEDLALLLPTYRMQMTDPGRMNFAVPLAPAGGSDATVPAPIESADRAA